MNILRNRSKLNFLILILVIGIFSYLPQLLTIIIIASDLSSIGLVLPIIGIIGSIIHLILRLTFILIILSILLRLLNKFDKKSFKILALNSPVIFSPFIIFGTIALTFRILNYYIFPELTGLRKIFEFFGALIAWIISFVIFGYMINEKLRNKKISGITAGITCIIVFLLIPPTI